MREDMFKIIVERPRTKGWSAGKGDGKKSRDLEDLPSKESMKPRRHYDRRKELNENLRPLERFLQKNSNIGRKWDEIFSEICEHIKLDSTVQRHVREHIEMMVITNTFMKNGKVYEDARGHEFSLEQGRHSYQQFFVHPVTGCLHYIEKRRWRHVPQKPKFIQVDKNTQLHQQDGIWYVVTLAPLPTYKEIIKESCGCKYTTNNWSDLRDMFLDLSIWWISHDEHRRSHIGHNTLRKLKETYGRGDVYAVAKKQANKKLLRLVKNAA